MSIRFGNVPGLAEPPGYRHFATAEGGGRLVFLAGQVPLDTDGNLVGERDAPAQARQVIANVLASLEAAGAGFDDVVKTTVYVAGASHQAQVEVWDVIQA